MKKEKGFIIIVLVVFSLILGASEAFALSFYAKNIPTDTGLSQGVAVGDVDGDGAIDIYVANQGLTQNKLWLNDGVGNFSSADISGDLNTSYDAFMFDTDGDSDLDIYTINRHFTQNNKLWMNDGAGNFTASDIVGDTGVSSGGAIGDVNNDTFTDIYVAVSNGLSATQSLLWLGDGAGNFTNNNIVGDVTRSHAAAIGDVTGDGNADIYVSNEGGDQNNLWIGDGVGGFTLSTILGDLGFSGKPVMGDVDGDGDLDIYVPNGSTSGADEQNKLWMNDGAGNFTANDIVGDVGRSTDATMTDVDLDGDLDIYVTNIANQQNKLWINDGTGNFTADDISGDLYNSNGSSIADFNGDGLMDIYVVNGGNQQNRLWLRDAPPTVTITAPTKLSNTSITDTTIRVTDDAGIPVANVVIGGGTTVPVSGYTCIQTSVTEVNCTISIDASGDLEITATDTGGNVASSSELGYVIDTTPATITINAPTKTSGSAITDTTITVTDATGILVSGVSLGAGTTAGTSGFTCLQTSPTRVDCTLSVDSSGAVEVVATDTAGNTDSALESAYLIDATFPTVTISAPTKAVTDGGPITNTTITVTDDQGILVSDVTVAGITTAGYTNFSCVQTNAVQVDCSISITTSGDLFITASDGNGNTSGGSELGYDIRVSSSNGGSRRRTPVDRQANGPVSDPRTEGASICPVFTQHMKMGDRDGKVGQNKQEDGVGSTIREIALLQGTLKALGFDAGPVDGIFGILTRSGVIAWQSAHRKEVLVPWGLQSPTGNFYQSSERWMNELLGCEDSVTLDNGVVLE